MKKKVFILLLIISLIGNVYFIAKNALESLHTENAHDRQMLGEMVKKTIESEDYQAILDKGEVIHSIETSLDRAKGGRYPFHYGVFVKTDKQTYMFGCKDELCGDVDKAGTTYSRYSEEEPMLPLKDN